MLYNILTKKNLFFTLTKKNIKKNCNFFDFLILKIENFVKIFLVIYYLKVLTLVNIIFSKISPN